MIDYDKARLKWDAKLLKNSEYKKIKHKLNYNKGATPEEVHQLAVIYSETLAETIEEITPGNLVNGKVPAEFANNVLSRLMHLLHDRVQDDSLLLQKQVNAKKQIGVEPVIADYETGRVEGILDRLIAQEYASIKWITETPVMENLALNSISNFCERNLERNAKAGVPMGIKRVLHPTESTCKWCASLEGEYEYPAPRDVYRRHVNCRCITYTIYPKGVQDVWSKTMYTKDTPNAEVMADIARRNADREQLKAKQAAYRNAKALETAKAKTMQELIEIGKQRGYPNPRGWAWNVYNNRKNRGA